MKTILFVYETGSGELVEQIRHRVHGARHEVRVAFSIYEYGRERSGTGLLN